ncbi:MAG: ATP-binding protein [Desulfobacterales bacterium]|nr:ATP-binding protein [Desulfobacterales bacterium]
MPEIVVLSGKGGTGKTSLTAAFAHLARGHVICDLDVDAPDLHLLLQPTPRRSETFRSGHEARIRAADCSRCGQCVDLCRFDAIRGDDPPVVNARQCEGCKLCVALCPQAAIDFIPRHCGDWHISDSRMGPMVHAQLRPGEENSGRLVAILREEARKLAGNLGRGLILSDGPPGVACPVISSLSGADLAIIVTEPTPSGRHDLERITALTAHFKIATVVIINKGNLNPEQTAGIKSDCCQRGLPVLATLPHDPSVTAAMLAGKTVTEYTANGFSAELQAAWTGIQRHLNTVARKE